MLDVSAGGVWHVWDAYGDILLLEAEFFRCCRGVGWVGWY